MRIWCPLWMRFNHYGITGTAFRGKYYLRRFSLAAKGYYVEDGKIERPVNQITIAGNFYEVLKNIEVIGEDLVFAMPDITYIGSPSLKIKNIAVAGE